MFEKATFRRVADLLPDAVVLTDAEGKITWTNKAFRDLCGHSFATVKHKKPGLFLQGPDTDPETVERIRRAIRDEEPVEAELINYHREGRPYWISLRITPIRNTRDELEGFIAVEREVTAARTEKNRMEREIVDLYASIVSMVEERTPEK